MLFDQSYVKRELNVPDNDVTVLPMILGYRAQIPETRSRKKPETIDEQVRGLLAKSSRMPKQLYSKPNRVEFRPQFIEGQ